MFKNRKFLSPFKVMFHPFTAFEEMKDYKAGNLLEVPLLILCFFTIRILTLVLSGFLFNTVKLSQVNLPLEFAAVVGIYLVFIISNWLFCDLTQSEAKLHEIALVTAFALMPYMISSLVNIALSNVLVTREAVFMSLFSVLGLLWSAIVGIVGLKIVHNFSAGKTIITLFVTVVFMALIAFLGVIIFSLTQQLLIFIKDIYNEIIYRM